MPSRFVPKQRRSLAAPIAGLAVLAGCSNSPTNNQTLKAPVGMKAGEIIDAAVDAASEAGLPAAAKVDKENGLVQFGAFGMPVLGYTAQVRIRSDGNIDVTVQRGSTYISRSPDEVANQFVAALQRRLQQGGKSARIDLHVVDPPTAS